MTTRRTHLEDFYSGDDAWAATVAIARAQWGDSDVHGELLRRVEDVSLAMVIFARMGEGCLEWLDTPVPALSGRKPINCLASEPLVRRLREAVMRMD